MAIDFSPLWNFSNPALSEQRFRAMLEGPAPIDAPDRAEVLTQLARAIGLQRRFDEARGVLDQAAALCVGNAGRPAIRLALERGRVINTSGDPAAASTQFMRAWELASGARDEALAVDAAHMLGIVEPDHRGMDWNMRALTLAESSTDPAARRWTASLRNNIGWWLHEHAQPEEALTQFELALADRERQGSRGPVLVARWTVARCLRTLRRVEEALKIQRELAAAHAASASADGFVHEEMAECLLLLGRADEARAEFRLAHSLLLANPAVDPVRLARLAAHAAGEPHHDR